MLEVQKKAKFANTAEEAEKMYEKQLQAIQAIVKTQGFKEIVAWFERMYTITDDKIDDAEDGELQKLIIERKVVKKHLNWLYNLSK